jgi:hypothetical protein
MPIPRQEENLMDQWGIAVDVVNITNLKPGEEGWLRSWDFIDSFNRCEILCRVQDRWVDSLIKAQNMRNWRVNIVPDTLRDHVHSQGSKNEAVDALAILLSRLTL